MSTPQSFPISFEFFPPKTPVGEEKLKQVRQGLYAARPAFFSVTYGAGGSTQDGTLQQVQAILADGHDAAPHWRFGRRKGRFGTSGGADFGVAGKLASTSAQAVNCVLWRVCCLCQTK